jgi:plastocyanin
MLRKIFATIGVVYTLACSAACAATVSVTVTDAKGAPAPNAVVSIASDSSTIVMPPHTPQKSIIDQRHETFIPLVVVVRKGGDVVFTNNDTTMHQVYSFSPIKQFQFEIDKGQVSKPIQFDKAGVAAIGCNIHDNMVAYVYVADAPFAVVTDANGRAEIHDVPEGSYRATVWHPQLRPGKPATPVGLTIGDSSGAKLALALPVTITAMPDMNHMHKSDY